MKKTEAKKSSATVPLSYGKYNTQKSLIVGRTLNLWAPESDELNWVFFSLVSALYNTATTHFLKSQVVKNIDESTMSSNRGGTW